MKSFANLLTSIVVAFWVIAIAIVSVQNAEPVSLKFFSYQSIKIPFGLVLAFSAGFGIIGIAILQPLWNLVSYNRSNPRSDDYPEFFTEDEDF
jgi:uncharacterized integral membrane protein